MAGCGNGADTAQGVIVSTGDEIGTYYQFGNRLAQQINTATTLYVAAVTSHGSRDNILSPTRGDAEFAFTQYDAMLYARKGLESFRVNGPNESFSVVTALYPESVHIVTLNPGITSVADLDVPAGCPFRNRCEHCTELCAAEKPKLRRLAPGHEIACHLFNDLPEYSGEE